MITASAKDILQKVNRTNIPDKELANLHSLLQIIVEYTTEGQRWNVSQNHAKEAISLMSRTNFSSMYHTLLSRKERKLFRKIVRSNAILAELGLTRKSRFFKWGYSGRRGPTIHNWLASIYRRRRDLLSPPAGGSEAMGRFPVKTRPGKKDTKLVMFEARKTSHDQDRPAAQWVDFAEGVFEQAHLSRPRTGSTALIFNPNQCPTPKAKKRANSR